jgi:hypothetical protein
MRIGLGKLAATVLLVQALPAGLARAEEPQALGTISVKATPVDPDLRASVPIFIDAVGKALAEKGFTTIEGAGHARFVADLGLTRTEIGSTTAKVPVTGSQLIQGGASSRVGGGASILLPTAKTRTVALQQTRLEVGIRKRGEDNVIWHGAVLTIRAAGQDKVISADLARAIFQTYPSQPDGIVSIP